MKRIQEKIKDLVEVRQFKSLPDFTVNPPQTLSAYYFTDSTAELMAKWLDCLGDLNSGSGQAKALAGYRGVGKSHFLGTLGAIISHPELRSRVTDGFVSAGAQRLKRKGYPVAYVRRGTHATLIEEIRDSIAKVFNVGADNLPIVMSQLMEFAAQTAGDVPFVLFVDTAFDRASRVARDDGEPLGELAALAKTLNFFVGVALDDDIAGADGVNAAIARSYSIDYLDQEHLYRIIDTNLFPKNRNTQHLLHEIYTDIKDVMPNFRWSEQRFCSVYPIHPIILEMAPYVRLYNKNFVLLDFVSEVGAKSAGHPANSLIALDEVFDSAEATLRESTELKEAFEAYDLINTEVIGAIPVMQRLQAKMILKALMMFSLSGGDGSTASEICSAMLIYKENDQQGILNEIEAMLETCYQKFPDKVHRLVEDGRDTRYCLKISGKDDLNSAAAVLAKQIPTNALERVFKKIAKEKLTDWNLQIEGDLSLQDTSDCYLTWRGAFRRGKIHWCWNRDQIIDDLLSSEKVSDFTDWEIFVSNSKQRDYSTILIPNRSIVVWQVDAIKSDEEEALKRYFVLLTDQRLHNEFGEKVRAAGHALHAQILKIWKRIFFDDAKLWIEGEPYGFSEEAKYSETLSDAFSKMLAPIFEYKFFQHPFFERNLGMAEVSQLVSDLFSGSKQVLPYVQQLAEDFALPLGLVVKEGNQYVLDSEETLKEKDFTKTVFELIDSEQESTVSLKKVYEQLKREPFGLGREAQQLILAALVAKRSLDFVTENGNRINSRSLDLRIIWDDIVAVAAPLKSQYAGSDLANWAKTLTGIKDVKTIENSGDCAKIYEALDVWLNDWGNAKLLEKFENLPDEVLNTRTWKLARHAQTTFSSVEATIKQVLAKSLTLEEGLERVADTFLDSEENFFNCARDLVVLEDFISGLAQRRKIWEFLALCETTKDENVENLRSNLLALIDKVTENPSETLNCQLSDVWQDFHRGFNDYFAVKHDTIMKSHLIQEKFDHIMASDEWWEFENLSKLTIFHDHYWESAQTIRRKFKELDCAFNVKEMLRHHPFCACSFSLSRASEWEKLPEKLSELIADGRKSYRKTLLILGETLAPLLENIIAKVSEPDIKSAATNLFGILDGGEDFRLLSNYELVALEKVVQGINGSPFLQVLPPIQDGFRSRDELSFQLNEWIVQLPSEPCLLKV